MPPNSASQDPNQALRKRLADKKHQQSLHATNSSKQKKSNKSFSTSSSGWSGPIGWMTIGCVIGVLLHVYLPVPQLMKQLILLKHQINTIGGRSTPSVQQKVVFSDSRPVVADVGEKEVGPDGEVYEYHQFMATVEQHFPNVSLHEVPCRYEGYSREMQRNAAPQRCGTLIFDDMIDQQSMHKLREMSQRYCTLLGDTNYHNRESYNLRWINLHHLFKYGPQENMFNEDDFELIRNTSEAVKHTVCSTFGLPSERIFFSPVSQFTRYKPVVPYQEFRHVDKVRSPYLIVTTILWLSTVDIDFGGGRTEFLTGGPEPYTPLLVEPKFGRFAAWTSGWENPHGVMEVEHGERLALIFAFTVHDDIGHKSMETLREWAMVEVPDRTPEQQRQQQQPAKEGISEHDSGHRGDGGGGY